MNKPIIQCEALSKIYQEGARQVEVIKHVDFSLSAGERVAIIGRSGSGKSTLLQCLAGLDKPTSGRVLWHGQSVEGLSEARRCALRNSTLGFVFQFHHLLPEFSALENVMMPLLIRGVDQSQALATAEQMLEAVGLSHRLSHRPQALSGGERQRVAIARALAAKPKCLLADEPTGNLDEQAAKAVFELLMSLSQAQGLALVLVTHDLSLASRMQTCYALVDGGLSLES
ncbi:MAG: lipoprotein-releasing system ATP-binding protein LolD [Gammaproteobacteria bacterium CG11_big_fil_rev_8_21_14_0_20_46_22]|nr:MAG: lipoprotein-releasing system ATP-binding protein LolD [Gammaproteobacteria bacterium CG12_big_fil_rev_8_21_14_0_65_46_12]PIR12154.1 MAG: lipoprotein-releasing system ATP-binding protein LolD [Gammaproteobacteria bacterium CG11_big_fil_rev_8_21_14_0_20_46_22]